eukprot:GHUV01043627.1.p1 GENE.GHUV01043627.1~~GHUV01043627.1.p1  ORF type:complete len:543 (+),score=232.84 GHUV01043627.1:96-1724(+)
MQSQPAHQSKLDDVAEGLPLCSALQYLPSALRDTGKRQLDCLGIATAVLALCQQISQHHQQHADLASSSMMVSDDHCWLSVSGAPGGPEVQVEVTDPRQLQPAHLSNWLYAGGHGLACSAANVVMILVAGMMPEELKDDAAADNVRHIQVHMLQQLAQQHPQAMFYSNYFRWGMLLEELELVQLATAAESGDMQLLQQSAQLGPQQLQSQQYYQQSQQLSTGWQWHPSSCAAFGWLNRLQAALCGNTDNLLALQPMTTTHAANQQQPHQGPAATWHHISRSLLQQALSSVQDCTHVLQKYSACAGKPDRAADQQLLEAVRDLWQNMADACRAVACLQQLQEHEQQQGRQAGQHSPRAAPNTADDPGPPGPPVRIIGAEAPPAVATAGATLNTDGVMQQGKQPGDNHITADVPATAPVTGHTVHLGAAVSRANLEFILTNQIENSSWLQAQLTFMDALCAYYGDDSTDLPTNIVGYFVEVASTYTQSARTAAIAAVAEQVASSRMKALADVNTAAGCAWLEVAPDLQQLVQMPSSRKRKRKEM